MNSFYIYKISNAKTGEYYYGRRKCKGTWAKDTYFSSSASLRKLCGGKTPKQILLPEWKKEVLLTFDNMKELIEYEGVVVGDRWQTDPLCLNKVPGGSSGGGDASQMHTAESVAKRTETLKVYYNTPEGKKHASDLGKRAKGKKKTITDDFKKAQGNRVRGRKRMHLGDVQKLVKAEEVNDYLSKGWKMGLPEWQKKQISENLKGKSYPKKGKS